VGGIDVVEFASSLKFRAEQSGCFQSVEFYPYAVGVFIELLGESLEVPAQILIEKEAK
jgi:hypothetical protein